MNDDPTRTADGDAILALPTPYYLFRLLTGSDHLHFGYFRSPEETVEEAQENMMRLNLYFRPRRLVRVLDVGCGLGATSRELSSQGCRVTAISPDGPLVEYARAAERKAPAGAPVEWIHGPFESWQPKDSFDLVLFQESFQYFDDAAGALGKAFGALRPGGRVIVGDQFLNERRPREATRFHFIDDVLAAARKVGFAVATTCDISGGALQTTRRMLEQLDAKRGELIQSHESRKPSIREDIDTMLLWGRRELGAFEGNLLSYRILVLDRGA